MLADGPAKILVLLESVKELLKVNEVAYGENMSDLLKNSNPNMLSEKMLDSLEKTDLELSSMILPESGMMQNGTLLPLPESVISRTRGNDCSLLPTPVASDAMNILGKNDTYKLTKNGRVRRHTIKGKNASLNLSRFVRFYPGPSLISTEVPDPVQNPLSPEFVELLMGFPQGLDEVRRKQRIKQLGNALVPGIVELIGQQILEITSR